MAYRWAIPRSIEEVSYSGFLPISTPWHRVMLGAPGEEVARDHARIADEGLCRAFGIARAPGLMVLPALDPEGYAVEWEV